MQRTFVPGSDWLYFKIYCGVKTADTILIESILPIIEENHNFKKFFFIRYADPKPHIRLRVRVSSSDEIGSIIYLVQKSLQFYVDSHLIWKIQLDTYNREIERYGMSTIELSEQLFQIDSFYILKFLNMIEGDDGETIRWHYALGAIDKLLNAFDYSIADKQNILEILCDNFGNEFGMNKGLKVQLDKKYRDNTKSILFFLKQNKTENEDYIPIFNLLDDYEKSIRLVSCQIKNEIEENNEGKTCNDLLMSYIHMLCNRLFKSKQRVHELVVYNLLCRYYKSEIAKQKKNKTNEILVN